MVNLQELNGRRTKELDVQHVSSYPPSTLSFSMKLRLRLRLRLQSHQTDPMHFLSSIYKSTRPYLYNFQSWLPLHSHIFTLFTIRNAKFRKNFIKENSYMSTKFYALVVRTKINKIKLKNVRSFPRLTIFKHTILASAIL